MKTKIRHITSPIPSEYFVVEGIKRRFAKVFKVYEHFEWFYEKTSCNRVFVLLLEAVENKGEKST